MTEQPLNLTLVYGPVEGSRVRVWRYRCVVPKAGRAYEVVVENQRELDDWSTIYRGQATSSEFTSVLSPMDSSGDTGSLEEARQIVIDQITTIEHERHPVA
jgi:hypothetical protein